MQTVSTEIDNSIQAVMMDLGNKLTPELSQEVASVYNLNAKFAFYNVCFSKVHDVLNNLDPKLASVFSSIQDTNVLVVSKFTEKLLALHPTIAELIQRLEEVEGGKKESHRSNIAGSDQGQERTQQMEELKREIAMLKDENKLAQERIQRQSREIERLKRESAVKSNDLKPRSTRVEQEPAAISTKNKK